MLRESPTANATRGERYATQVPDTLDLAWRMSLAVNALRTSGIPK